MPRKKRKRKHYHLKRSTKIVIAIIAFVVFGILMVLILSPKEESLIKNASVSFEKDVEAVIIRDEASYYSDFDFSNINFSANEGDKVTAGQEIGIVYKLGYTDDVAQNLYDIQKQIYEKQMTLLSGINKPEVDAIQSEIEKLTQELQSLGKGDVARKKEIESLLKEQIASRNTLLRTMVQPTEELSELYREEEVRLQQLNEWTNTVVSAADGRLSTYFDGYEQRICYSKLSSVSPSQVERAIKEKDAGNDSTENLMYRLVNDTKFCIAFIVDADETPQYYENERYSVTLDGNGGGSYTGKCVKRTVSGDSVLSIIEIESNLGDLISMRTVEAKISGSFTGMRVAAGAVSENDNKFYIEVQTGVDTSKKVQVDVLAMNEEYAIIRESGNGTGLSNGQTYLMPKS